MTVLSALAGARGPGRYATLVGAALAWVLVALSTPAAANATDAGAFIESMAEQAVKALTNKDISRDERIDRFRHLLRERFDVPVIGRWVLGRHWRRATDDQREEYLHLFEDLIILTYVDRFTDYSGETLRVVKTIQGSDRDSLVRSVLDRPGSEKPLEVDWRVRETDGELRVIDVIVAGISMGQSQKDQFASTLSKEGGRIGALLAKLRKQVHDGG
ncbi:MAG: ABC transporter substrate-binding protein [Rhodobacterales bacterium]|nr:ABC transporter substrate-binding protein [Rhodobacterales bacterium]